MDRPALATCKPAFSSISKGLIILIPSLQLAAVLQEITSVSHHKLQENFVTEMNRNALHDLLKLGASQLAKAPTAPTSAKIACHVLHHQAMTTEQSQKTWAGQLQRDVN